MITNINLFHNYIFFQYMPIFIFFIISLILAIILLVVSFFVSTNSKNSEKMSPYECGFDPFNYKDNQSILNIRFYLVGILFIIFDIELIFLYPWIISLNKITLFGFWSMFIFLFILTIGFIYEWKKGSLEWE